MEGHKETGAGQAAASIGDTPLAVLTVMQLARALAVHAALVSPKGDSDYLDQAERDTRRILDFIEHGTRLGVLSARTPSQWLQRNGKGGSYASSSGTGAG